MIISKYQQNSQPTFTSSKLTLETVEQEAKYVQVEKKDTRAMSFKCVFMLIDAVLVLFFVSFAHISHRFLVFLLLTLNR